MKTFLSFLMPVFLFTLFTLFTHSVYSQSATVIVENANLRGTPNQAGRVVTTLSSNSIVEIIKQNGAWFLVQSPEYAGWLHGNTIRLDSATASDDYETEQAFPTPKRKTKVYSAPKASSSETYLTGPRGGCYYINRNGNKTYVSRSLCN